MDSELATGFPIRITDVESYRHGELFLADLEAFGPRQVCPRTLIRSLCTITAQFRDAVPEGIILLDHVTAVVEYSDATKYQLELLLDDNPVDSGVIDNVQRGLRDGIQNLLVVTNGSITRETQVQCDADEHTDILMLDHHQQDGCGIWKT